MVAENSNESRSAVQKLRDSMKGDKPRWESLHVLRSSTMSPPAVRSFVFWRMRDEKGEWHVDKMPVLAIESRLIERYARRADFHHLDAASTATEDLKDARWEYRNERIDYGPIVAESEFGLINMADSDFSDEEWILIVATWPDHEDDERFGNIAGAMRRAEKLHHITDEQRGGRQ